VSETTSVTLGTGTGRLATVIAGRIIGLVIGALVLRVVLELAGYFWWPQEGADMFSR
jgi:hypothetical protein